MSLISTTADGCELVALLPYPSVASTDNSVVVAPVVGPDGKTTFDLSASLATEVKELYEYRDIWAEESGGLTANSAEWSFGNGATGFMGLPIDSGWQVEAMYFQADTYPATATVTIDLMDYGSSAPGSAAANTLASLTMSSSTDGGGATNNGYKYEVLATPVDIPVVGNSTVIGFITRGLTGAISDARIGVRLRRSVGSFLVAASVDAVSEGPSVGTPADGALVSDNFQDGNGNAPFNLQIRNTTGTSVPWVAVLNDVPYATIPSLNTGNYTLSTTGTGPYTHTFTGTVDLGPYANITITGGTPSPPGVGNADGNPEFYIQ